MVVSNIRRASTSFFFQSLIASSLRSGPSAGTGAACPSIGSATCRTKRVLHQAQASKEADWYHQMV